MFEVLFESTPTPAHTKLEELYGGCLNFEATDPYLIVNFVSTIDGAVIFEGGDSSKISQHSSADRLLMGMLRSLADAVLVGAGTVRKSPSHQWTASILAPEYEKEFLQLREHVGKSGNPPTYIASKSGELPEINNATVVQGSAQSMVEKINKQAGNLILCEGGPHLFGQLLSEGLVNELFLTVSPQLIGRDLEHPRLALVEGTTGEIPGELISVRKNESHLFLRYRL